MISDPARLQFGILITYRFISVPLINLTQIVYKVTLIFSGFLSGGCPMYSFFDANEWIVNTQKFEELFYKKFYYRLNKA
jgi:hypothetical protein